MRDLDIMAAFTGKRLAEEKAEEYLWPGLSRATVALLAGQDGVGKSFYAKMAGIAVACSDPRADLLGLNPSTHGKVIHFVCEDDMPTVRERLEAIAKLLPAECLQQIHDNLTIRLLEEIRYDLRTPADIAQVTKECAGYAMVLIDTLNDFHLGKTNDPADMLDYMKGCARIAQANNQVVMNVHHVTKQSIRDGDDSTNGITGGGPITAKSRYTQIMRTMTKNEGAQLSYGPDRAPIVTHAELSKFVCVGVRKASRGNKVADRWYRRNEDGILLPIILHKASANGSGNRKGAQSAGESGKNTAQQKKHAVEGNVIQMKREVNYEEL